MLKVFRFGKHNFLIGGLSSNVLGFQLLIKIAGQHIALATITS
jgi:hypothetical protein